jgi:hypothetical protein
MKREEIGRIIECVWLWPTSRSKLAHFVCQLQTCLRHYIKFRIALFGNNYKFSIINFAKEQYNE